MDRNAAEAVVSAEFENHERRMRRDDIINPGEAVSGGIAAYALIIDSIMVAVLVQKILKILRVAWTRNTLCEAIPESNDDRALVFRSGRRLRGGRLGGLRG